MKINAVFAALQSLAEQMQVTIRMEKGSFNGGYCLLRDKRVIVINKILAIETKVAVLSQALAELGIEQSGVSIPPAVQVYLDRERRMPITIDVAKAEQIVE